MSTSTTLTREHARIGGYATAARYGHEGAVARGRASVAKRFAAAADPDAALRAQMARVNLARAQKRARKTAQKLLTPCPWCYHEAGERFPRDKSGLMCEGHGHEFYAQCVATLERGVRMDVAPVVDVLWQADEEE